MMLACLRRGGAYLFSFAERRPGAPVDLFFYAAPPRRCTLLFEVVSHRHAAAEGTGDDEAVKDYC